MTSIRIGLPIYRNITPQTFAALWQLRFAEVVLDVEVGADVGIARNKIVRRLEEPYLLFLDADMGFSPQHIKELYLYLEENPRIGALSGHYIRWDGSGLPVCHWRRKGHWISDRERVAKCVEYQKEKSVAEVDCFGGGILLIRQEVFKKIPDPWFYPSVVKNEYWGNDTTFCQRAKKAGFKPSVHFGVQAAHYGPTEWTPAALEAIPIETFKDTPPHQYGDGDAN